MDVAKSLQKIAEEMGGSFTEYSDNNLIITVPVSDTRFQAITSYLIERNGNKVIEFASKVCESDMPGVNYKEMLVINQTLTYSKIVIFDSCLQLAAEFIIEHLTEDILRNIILEIGKTADQLEMEITKADAH